MAVLFDHRWPDDPRLIEVGAIGGWLLVRALCYSDAQETDGFVPGGIVRREAAAHTRKVDDTVNGMVRVGIFGQRERDGIAGFQIHADFLKGQFTKAEKAEHRRKKAEAGRVGGRKSGEVRRKQTGSNREATASGVVEADAKQTANQNEAPSPSPSPPQSKNRAVVAGKGVQGENQISHAAPSAAPLRGSATSDAGASSAALADEGIERTVKADARRSAETTRQRDGQADQPTLAAAATKDSAAPAATAGIAAGDGGAAAFQKFRQQTAEKLRSKGLDV